MEHLNLVQISIPEFKSIITETLREELKSVQPQHSLSEKTEVYGTRKEVAKELRLSLPTLSDLTKRGLIKGYRIGGRVLYRWEEVFSSLEQIKSLRYKR